MDRLLLNGALLDAQAKKVPAAHVPSSEADQAVFADFCRTEGQPRLVTPSFGFTGMGLQRRLNQQRRDHAFLRLCSEGCFCS